jgi:hypothetical protein
MQENISLKQSGSALCRQRQRHRCCNDAPTSPSNADDEDEAVKLKDAPRSNPELPKFQLYTMSTYLYAAVINDSKTLVNTDIRKRQTQITEAKEKVA